MKADATESANSPSRAVFTGPAHTPTIKAVAGDGQVTLSWPTARAATAYLVKRRINASFTGGSGFSGSSASDNWEYLGRTEGFSWVDSGLTNGTTYTYTVSTLSNPRRVITTTNIGGYLVFSSAKWVYDESVDATPVDATPNAALFAPSGLRAEAGNASALLFWTPAGGAVKYEVARGPSSSGPFTALTPQPTLTTFSDSGLTNGTTYYYTVTTLGTGTTRSAASPAIAVQPGPPPAQVTGLSGVAGDGQITLSWTAVSGASTYAIYRTGLGSTSWQLRDRSIATSYTDDEVRNGATYLYMVRAVALVSGAADLFGPPSNTVTLTPVAIPAAPLSLTATPGNAQVLLQWTSGARATSYDVWRQAGTTAWAKVTPTALSSSTQTYIQTGLVNGTNYSFLVRGVDTAGKSVDSNTVTVTPAASILPLMPAAPTFGNTTSSSIDVIPPILPFGATSLSLFMAPGQGLPGVPGQPLADDDNITTPVASGITTTTPITVSGLGAGANYRFRAIAVNSAGQKAGPSATTTTTSVTPPVGAPAAPEAPRFGKIYYVSSPASHVITAMGIKSPGATSLAVQWKQSGDPDSVFTSAGHEVLIIAQYGDPTVSSAAISGFAGVTAYVFRLKAINSSGSTYGPNATATTLPDPPAAPAAPTVASTSIHSITVNVPALPARATSLTLSYGGGTFKVPNVTGTTYVITGLTSGMSLDMTWFALGNCLDSDGNPVATASGVTNSVVGGVTGTPDVPLAPKFFALSDTSVGVIAPNNVRAYSYAPVALKLQIKTMGAADSTYLTPYTGLACDPTGGELQRLVYLNNLTPGASYTVRYVAYVPGSSTPESPGISANITMLSASTAWSVGGGIACSGIRYPFDGLTLQSGATGRLNAWAASDWDLLTRTVNGFPALWAATDTCSYSWTAISNNTAVGTFPDGASGPTVTWQAPVVSVPTAVTLTLVVKDQVGLNQGTSETGARADVLHGAGDLPLNFSINIQVLP